MRKTLFAVTLCLAWMPAISCAQATMPTSTSALLPRLGGYQDGRSNAEFRKLFAPAIVAANASTLRVRSDGKQVALATVVRADGYLLTKASELPEEPVVRLGGKNYRATVVGTVVAHDLAMLKIDPEQLGDLQLTPVKWADSAKVRVGEWLVTPDGTSWPLAVGVVSVDRRTIPAMRVLLGISLNLDRDDAPTDGVQIKEIVVGMGAADAGLRAGDVILELNGQPVKSNEELRTIVASLDAGSTVKVHYRRGEKQADASVKLRSGAMSLRATMQNTMGGELSARSVGFPSVIQHDTVLQPRDCGGPIVDLDGKALGINIARAGRVESYFLPADLITPLIDDFIAGKYAVTPTTRATTKPST